MSTHSQPSFHLHSLQAQPEWFINVCTHCIAQWLNPVRQAESMDSNCHILCPQKDFAAMNTAKDLAAETTINSSKEAFLRDTSKCQKDESSYSHQSRKQGHPILFFITCNQWPLIIWMLSALWHPENTKSNISIVPKVPAINMIQSHVFCFVIITKSIKNFLLPFPSTI